MNLSLLFLFSFSFFFFLLVTASALDTGVTHGDERSSSAELDFLCGYGVNIMIT